jgi:aspartate/methionine/tyrosine aminotransferase
MWDDVYSVQAYREARKGVSETAARLSVGRNLRPPSRGVVRYLSRCIADIFESNRLASYETAKDSLERNLIAQLVSKYLDQTISADHIFLTTGSQEAISLVCAFGATAGYTALLPLPLYYAFEQSSVRWGVPIAGYYDSDGKIFWISRPKQELLHAIIFPNSITGRIFKTPVDTRECASNRVAFTLVDCIYQIGEYGTAGDLARITRMTARTLDLESSAFVFTASKDLSLPGLRAGILVSKNGNLLRYLTADRFERLYSTQPTSGSIIALYFGLLLMKMERDAAIESSALYNDLTRAFSQASLQVPSFLEMHQILDDLDRATMENARALEIISNLPFCTIDENAKPFAGYSVFPHILLSGNGGRDFVSWVRSVGLKYQLKLNPRDFFGATPTVWDALYPGFWPVRVNLSAALPELISALKSLETAVRDG